MAAGDRTGRRRSRRVAVAWRLALCAAGVVVAAPLAAQDLPSFRDAQFAYPPVIASEFGGDYRVFADDPGRDPARRDNAGGRVRPPAPALGVRRNQRDVPARVGIPAHVAVGQATGARLIVVYVHGTGGSRNQGVDDFAAAGNFNRVKNLLANAKGLYLSPDVASFDAKGTAEVAALIAGYAATSPGAPMIVACGSAGGVICYGLGNDPQLVPRLAGLMLLGTYADAAFPASAAVKARVPVLIGHGAADKIFPVAGAETLFRTLHASGSPVRMIRFDNGNHGSPIRMVDWREAIDWMLATR